MVYIDVVKGFQTSVNIALDLYNDDKIKNFIPTISFLDLAEEILNSISGIGKRRARLLVGAYGRGKSHYLLVLLSLLFRKDTMLFGAVLDKMKAVNPPLYEYTMDYINSDKKLLPVIVAGNSANLQQSLLNALQQALRNEGLSDIMPETNFSAAINTITLWQTDYPDTYARFVKELVEPINDYMVALGEFDTNAYNKFTKLYPMLTSGGTFNPFVGFDVIEVYEKVVDKLSDIGYNGVYVIYDEFSKYLESSIATATHSETLQLQQFGEMCDRTGSNKQIHLMLISHKDMDNYIESRLPKEKVDGWRGVSGRFLHMHLHNNYAQMYEIISAVIVRDAAFWERLCCDFGERFQALSDRFTQNSLIEGFATGAAVWGCYPLHPVTTFILPRLSEKIAQNERTLFTFLSSDSKLSLPAFLRAHFSGETLDFVLVTPDYVYDYFEPLLRREHYSSDIYGIYRAAVRALEKLDEGSLAAKIIKTIALIYVVEQYEKLPPVVDYVVDTFRDVYDVVEIESALEYLIKNKYILYLKRNNGYLKIKESSGVDINAVIADTIERIRATVSVKRVLNQATVDGFLYPTAYNDAHEIQRYFDFTFIDSAELFACSDIGHKIKGIHGVGVVYAVVPSDAFELEGLRQAVLSDVLSHERVLFTIPERYVDIEKIALEYSAVKILKEQAAEDKLLCDELDVYIEDLEEVISGFVSMYTRPELGSVTYYHAGKRQYFARRAQISAKLSEICEHVFPYSPIINNESINKDVLPAVAINSRGKLIAGLLQNELEYNLGLSGSGQEVSIMRSVLIQTGVLVQDGMTAHINLEPDDLNMRKLLATISVFFFGASGKTGRSFGELYEQLTSPEYGFGLKKGVIPIFVAAVLHSVKRYLVIKRGTEEVRITADLLNGINENPDNFTVLLEDWSDDKTAYINTLTTLFADFVSERERDFNIFTYVTNAIVRWYMSLPKYAKELKVMYHGKSHNPSADKIGTANIRFLESLKTPNINAREYLFVKLFGIYGFSGFTPNITANITEAKRLFDNAKTNLIAGLINDVKSLFDGQAAATLASVIKDWYEGLKPTTAQHLFDRNESKILKLMASVTGDERTFIERLGKAVTGLRLDDWNAATIDMFFDELLAFKQTVMEFDSHDNADSADDTDNRAIIGSASTYKFTYVDDTGTKVVRTFAKQSYSDRAKLLYNDIAASLEEMGQSITEQEKRQVLIELLEKLC